VSSARPVLQKGRASFGRGSPIPNRRELVEAELVEVSRAMEEGVAEMHALKSRVSAMQRDTKSKGGLDSLKKLTSNGKRC
jgi:hypothetical protein